MAMRMHAQKVIAKSHEGRDLVFHVLGPSNFDRCLMVLGTFHGDEPKSAYLVEKLVSDISSHHKDTTARSQKIRWVLMPVVNPDGYHWRTRRNARMVDLNRNFPTKNWEVGNPRSRMFGGLKPASEPETRAVIRLIEKYKPDAIVTIHSIDRNRFCNNYDGPGRKLAQQLSRYNKYPATSTIGYPTPGSFGTWAGVERGVATVTLELPSHHSAKRCWEDNRRGLLSLGL
jgi:murein peptide amidase A